MRPDDQGELGEHYFVGLCIRAGIDCNKATWDKTGWDFRIELRPDPYRPTRGLDKELKPSTFLVQVKTVTAGKRSVRLSLAAADKLAKDPQNSLILVLHVEHDMIVGMTIIPVIDIALREILRALRKCDIEAPREYRRRNVSLSLVGAGVDAAPTPEALRAALDGFAEEDAFEHAARKQKQIHGLGYGARPIVGTFKTAKSDADMVSFFLGEKAVDVHALTVQEYRFGIPKKILNEAAGATMRLDSEWVTNVVTFGSKLARGQVSLDGKMFAMPFPELGRLRLRIVTDAMQIDITDDSANFSPISRESSARLSLKSRVKTCQAYEYILMGRTTFLVRPEKEKRFEITSEDDEQTSLLHDYQTHHTLLKKFLDVVHEAGLKDYEISDNCIEATASKIANLHNHLSRPFTAKLSNLSYATADKIPGLPSPGEEIDAYVTDYIALDEHLIGHYFVGRACLIDRGTDFSIEFRRCVIRDLAALEPSVGAYDTYTSYVERDYVGALGIIMNKQLDDA